MTLEEAIKHAEEVEERYKWFEENYLENKEYKERAEEHIQLAEWLKELKQLREQARWIPVSERLPKESGKYWCTFGGTYNTGIDSYTTEEDAKENFEEPEEYVGWNSQNVIAWMPLPKPYIAESEEE